MIKTSKKRALCLFLAVFSLVFLCLSAFSLGAYGEEKSVSLSPAFGGWENWTGSPNNPTPGGAPGVTQLLVGISDHTGQFPSQLDSTELLYKITFFWDENGTVKSKTVSLKPATVAKTYKLVRFETVLGEGENQFIPYKNQSYTVSISVTDQNGNTFTGTSSEYAFTVPMFPVVNGVEDQSYIYNKGDANYPYTLDISQYHKGTVDVEGTVYQKSDWEIWNGKQMLIMMISKKDIYSLDDFAPGTTVGLTFNDSKEYKVALDSTVDMSSHLLLRLPTEAVFTPENGKVYDIGVTVYKDEITAYNGIGNGFTADGVMVTPQTGDGAMTFIALAVVAVMTMSYILMPKSMAASRRGHTGD